MKHLGADDLLDLDHFEAVRDELRAAVIAHKAERRVAVADRVSLVFEDRETLRWQVLEMARVEGIRDPRALQQELDVYNGLIPGEGELSATLFIEITDLARIQPELDRLVGLDAHVALVLGEGPGAQIVPARFDTGQLEDDRIAAVQYVRFALDAGQQERLRDPAVPASLRIDHPEYRAEARLEPATRRSLVRDLAGGAGPLLDFAAARRAEVARDEVVAETALARAVRLARPPTPGHVIVEPRQPVASFLEASPELVAELATLTQRVARDLVARHGSARIALDVAERPLRWHVAPVKD